MNKLLKTFKQLEDSTYKNVHGVFVHDTGKGGNCLGITICTHGNEPCGLAVAEQFLNGKLLPKHGKIIVVLNNIKATKNYFKATNDEERKACRFVNVNMNRLPSDLNGDSYEIDRATELLPIWNEFDFALDIHSTAQSTPAMLIEGLGDAEKYMQNMPVDIVIRNIVQTQIGTPAIGFYGSKCKSIGLEAGSHEDKSAQTKAVECTKALMVQLDMLEGKVTKHKTQKTYTVHSGIKLPNKNYSLSRVFPMFSQISKNETIATDGQNDIISPIDGLTILGPKSLTPTNYDEEALFICTTK